MFPIFCLECLFRIRNHLDMGNCLILFHRYEPVFEALHRSLPVVAGELFVCLFAISKRTWPQLLDG